MAVIEEREDKLDQLASNWGMSRDELLGSYVLDSVAPAICMNPGCDFSTEYEPDQDGGWCDECGTRSVVSALVLAGVM